MSMKGELDLKSTSTNSTINLPESSPPNFLAMKLDRMGFAIGLAMCYFLGFTFKSVASWINLR